jgi:hypothetical protein
MECKPTSFSIKDLVSAWRSGSLKINQEYQRGAAWTLPQMQGLIDSLFRRYPIPPLFLHQITETGLGGNSQTRYEIVDGQQRIRALVEYFADKFPLLEPTDKKLRLPNSLRSVAAPWSKRRYSELGTEEKGLLDSQQLDAFLITKVADTDEIRDLFIRLQSGTALSRQQIRDAWPGSIGPFVEMMAGKLDRTPSAHLFKLVDKRGQRNEDERDRYDADRQFCAQLLCLFLAHERDPLSQQSITADDLDKLYHENTKFDPRGSSALRFKDTLDQTTKAVEEAIKQAAQTKRKFRKLDVIALFLVISDLLHSPYFKFDRSFYAAAASQLLSDMQNAVGKATSGPTIAEHYKAWQQALATKVGIRLDPKRLFDEADKKVIWERDKGVCQICKKAISLEEAEFDHYPTPHALGGPTKAENGRVVCKPCHPRGALAVQSS